MKELLEKAQLKYPPGTLAFDAKYKREQSAYRVGEIIIQGEDLVNKGLSYIYSGKTNEWAEILQLPENYKKIKYEIYYEIY